MPAFDIEKPEGYHPVNSQIKENGESNGNIIAYPSKHETASLKPPRGLHFCVKHTPPFYITYVSVILNLAQFIILLSLLVRAREPSPALPSCPPVQITVLSCPNGWIGYQEKCYYFSKTEENWTSSQWHCSFLNASLVMVDSQEEMDFMMRYKGNANHWIGLRNLNTSWTWINGTSFNDWFTILGGGSCAYMNRHSIASSSCSSKELWICSKPVVR